MYQNIYDRQEMNVSYSGNQHGTPTQAPPFTSQGPVPQFPSQLQVPMPAGAQMPPTGAAPGVTGTTPTPQQMGGMLPLEQSYVENILRFNRGKWANVYQTFEYNPEWPARVFRGIIEEAGRDHLILSNPETGKYYLLLMVNLDYVEFDEPIEYVTPALPGFVQSAPVR